MRIALICTEKLPVPPIAGGAVQQYIEGIVPYLSKEHDITVYSISHPALFPNEVVNNVRYIRFPAANKQEYINALKNNIHEGYDLIHILNRPQWILALCDGLPNTRFSLSLHNEMFHTEKITPENAIKCINRVEFISTVSKFIADGVKISYPQAADKLKVIYSAANPEKYEPIWSSQGLLNKYSLKRKYNIENYKVILFVGRFGEKKGAHILMKAMKEVMNYRKDVALVMIGSKWYGDNKIDDYTKSLYLLAKGLSGPVVFTGFLAPSEIPFHYNIGDIFVCASQWNEPLARVHYEAMAAGLPIITTNRGGNAEVVSGLGNGIIIDDYKNPEQFSYNIYHLLNSPELSLQMGMAGRKLVEERFNWKRVSEDLLREIEKIKKY